MSQVEQEIEDAARKVIKTCKVLKMTGHHFQTSDMEVEREEASEIADELKMLKEIKGPLRNVARGSIAITELPEEVERELERKRDINWSNYGLEGKSPETKLRGILEEIDTHIDKTFADLIDHEIEMIGERLEKDSRHLKDAEKRIKHLYELFEEISNILNDRRISKEANSLKEEYEEIDQLRTWKEDLKQKIDQLKKEKEKKRVKKNLWHGNYSEAAEDLKEIAEYDPNLTRSEIEELDSMEKIRNRAENRLRTLDEDIKSMITNDIDEKLRGAEKEIIDAIEA